mmetsp:Transcript_41493/g.132580  ORF Transcript_41493/g.132580 Transcript_41493/m.132580 type:complete len:233 (-) Transcript_41493:958-1656(-)
MRASACLSLLLIRFVSPKSSSTGRPVEARGLPDAPQSSGRRTRKFPGCGSALKTPAMNIWWAYARVMSLTRALQSTPASLSSRPSDTTSLLLTNFIPSMWERMRTSVVAWITIGTSQWHLMAGLSWGGVGGYSDSHPTARSATATSLVFVASCMKSSSFGTSLHHSNIAGRRSYRGSIFANKLMTAVSSTKSPSNTFSTPRCRTFTTTGLPSRTARCTCAIDAVPSGTSSNS